MFPSTCVLKVVSVVYILGWAVVCVREREKCEEQLQVFGLSNSKGRVSLC